MNSKIKYGVFFMLVLLFSSFSMHKFYVSVTQIDENVKKGRIEISSRIFIDDLEKALDKKYNKKLFLATSKELPEAKQLIQNYLADKMRVTINGKVQKLVFLGSEYEDDVLICYLKVDNSQKIATFEFFNAILTEIYSEQQNLVHTNINHNKKSFLLTNSERLANIEN
jgi:hypothetical protein